MTDHSLSRRRFLGLSTGLVTGVGLVGSGLWRTDLAHALAQADGPLDTGGRTLVVIDMQGGNDAINTLVPATGRYHDLRPTLALSDDDLVSFAGLDYGVHPSLGSLEPLWNAGQMACFHGVGMPQQSRSHFVAQDAWRSARPGEPARSGWLGRWLEATSSPTDSTLRAITLGANTLAAESESGRPVAVQSVDEYRLRPPNGNDAVVAAMAAMASVADSSEAGLFADAQAALPAAIESVSELQSIIAGVDGGASGAPDDGFGPDDVATLLSAAQAIIQADVGTRVIYLTVDGFDTHAVQAQIQSQLLAWIADGVAMMFDGLTATGHDERTLVLTTSEFGRRAAENGSAGTDHGNGGLSMLFGPAVRQSAVYGGADLNDLVNGDLPQVIDTRSVYDNCLAWLGGSSDIRQQVLGGDWSSLEALRI